MIAELVLAGVCAAMPLFDMSGPVCLDADEGIECMCTECFAWEPSTGATSYRVYRRDDATGTVRLVGENRKQDWIDEDGIPRTVPAATLWCFGRDQGGFPREGELYRYDVMACNTSCSAPSNPVFYRGAPYACWAGGIEVACYAGDPLIDRTRCFRGTTPVACPGFP